MVVDSTDAPLVGSLRSASRYSAPSYSNSSASGVMLVTSSSSTPVRSAMCRIGFDKRRRQTDERDGRLNAVVPTAEHHRGLRAGGPVVGVDLVEEHHSRLLADRTLDPEGRAEVQIGQAAVEHLGGHEEQVGRGASASAGG